MESISDVLKLSLKNWNLESKLKKYSLFDSWEEIVGKSIASKAQPARIMGHILVIEVISHPWMTELTHMKPVLLEKIRNKIKDCPIKNLRFELKK